LIVVSHLGELLGFLGQSSFFPPFVVHPFDGRRERIKHEGGEAVEGHNHSPLLSDGFRLWDLE
jgi:hypothetical protein